MGRKAIQIDKVDLERELIAAESSQTFPNHNQLFKFLGDKFNCASIIVRNRILDYGLDIKTPKGKKGRQAGSVLGSTPRTRKGKASDYKLALEMVFNRDGMEARVNKAAKGSLKSAVALKCFECAGFSKKEVRLCTCVGCPLFAYRPWVDKQTLTEEGREKIRTDSNKEQETSSDT